MKTAKEILKEHIRAAIANDPEGTTEFQEHVAETMSNAPETIEAMKVYAEAAISEDRKQVAKHAEAYLKDSLMTYQKYIAVVDESSIINAPRLTLT